ncbi:hypothetical protein AT984_19555 [Paucibacter sp. KCTC 42545]|nr:hypothetical protein AT984_19555 [Paucibacter sp. KCTC 42545]
MSAGNTLGLQGASVNIAAGLNTQSSDMQGVQSSGFSQAASSQQSLSGGTLTAGKDLTVIAKTGDITLRPLHNPFRKLAHLSGSRGFHDAEKIARF